MSITQRNTKAVFFSEDLNVMCKHRRFAYYLQTSCMQTDKIVKNH